MQQKTLYIKTKQIKNFLVENNRVMHIYSHLQSYSQIVLLDINPFDTSIHIVYM